LATYSKPFLSIPQQIAQLKQRGMIITDDNKAGHYLERLGYYRLSGYWYPMRVLNPATASSPHTISDQFRVGTQFQHVADLYVFDKQLRMLLLDGIERIEVALRVAIAIKLGQQNPYAHMEKSLLHGNFAKKTKYPDGPTGHDEWISRYRRCVNRSHEEFKKHFDKKYPSQGLPIWMAIEVWDFGLMSTFMSGMAYNDQTDIAWQFGFSRNELLIDWIRALNEARNNCAHHSRVWNKPLINSPTPPKRGESQFLDHIVGDKMCQTRVYIVAVAIQFLLRTINPTSSWSSRLKTHFQTFPIAPGVSTTHTGFPAGWEQLLLWN
jgi:abortive infection bacteriophage resistance protein